MTPLSDTSDEILLLLATHALCVWNSGIAAEPGNNPMMRQLANSIRDRIIAKYAPRLAGEEPSLVNPNQFSWNLDTEYVSTDLEFLASFLNRSND